MEISVEIAALDWLRWKKTLARTSGDHSDPLISVQRLGWWKKTYAIHIPATPFSKVKQLAAQVCSLLECVRDSPTLSQLHQICVTYQYSETGDAARAEGPAFFWNADRAERARLSFGNWWQDRLTDGARVAELPGDDGSKVMFCQRERNCFIHWRNDSEGVKIRLAANNREVLSQFFQQLSWLLSGGLWGGTP